MGKYFFSSQNCYGATLENGHQYGTDRKGFIHVDNPTDAKMLKDGGYVQAGGMPRLCKFWLCECGWEASISHCPKCDRDDLTKVER